MAYLTRAEYRAAPTAVDSNNLVAGGNQAAQDAALDELLAHAQSIIETRFTTSFDSTLRTELHRVRYQRDGSLSIKTDWVPLNQLVTVHVGTDASNLTAVSSLTGAFINEQNWVIPISTVTASGYPLQLGSRATYSGKVLVKLTLVAGWPSTVLASSASAGAASITVASGYGFTPALGSHVQDEPVRVVDGASTETISVASVAGNVLTLSSPLVNAHAAGVAVSAMPGVMREAMVLITSSLIRNRQNEALSGAGQTMQPGPSLGDMGARGPGINAALNMLNGLGRVR